ncbi:uncharacterized protein BDR25DRAFT_360854 [Lindgomyces ingoldianus]|uniref:Uncharacterized protein n=1 Tax=Lindgomyces ingoldianus TaxID=673940 RepID=A0ACB6QGF2_9PLEO|nr:uncharacterized protein BDR25DRAFT_360854 [Lindgomyces ingoldianus]KAF2465216.1 hypothetical protein BDR25DRAFT_360854 [Lindgomyces ingoldianus]
MLHLLLILLHLFYSSAVHAETQPSNVTIIEPIFIRRCPFQVNVSLATDLSSLDIAFLTKSANPGPPPLGVYRCYVRVQIAFDKTVYTYTINEVEYVPENASTTADLYTQFAPVTLSSASSAQAAKNTTLFLMRTRLVAYNGGLVDINVISSWTSFAFNTTIAGASTLMVYRVGLRVAPFRTEQYNSSGYRQGFQQGVVLYDWAILRPVRESTQRHMGALYEGYQKTTELAKGRVMVGADTGTLRIESLQRPARRQKA